MEMSSFGLTYFDKALDNVIDGFEHTVARAAASDLLAAEFKAPAAQTALPAVAVADLSKLDDVVGFWRLFNLQVTCGDVLSYHCQIVLSSFARPAKFMMCLAGEKEVSSREESSHTGH